MNNYKYRKKCLLCKEMFSAEYSATLICSDCDTKRKGDKETRKMVRKSKLQNNNPKGYNKHNKNPVEVVAKPTIMQEFEQKTETEQKEEVAQMGNQLFMLRKEIRPLLLKFNRCKEFYEKKHFGWDWSD